MFLLFEPEGVFFLLSKTEPKAAGDKSEAKEEDEEEEAAAFEAQVVLGDK